MNKVIKLQDHRLKLLNSQEHTPVDLQVYKENKALAEAMEQLSSQIKIIEEFCKLYTSKGR